jgi:orotidine-5'-phosphate decarboxylase
MTYQELVQQIKTKESFLCVGLDPDPVKIPAHLQDLEDPVFEFCKAIIDATLPWCVAYKPNTAFFEAQGLRGWESLEKVIAYIPKSHLSIADAKRGDIGNTGERYAKSVFESLRADAITVAPYMGADSIKPFLVPEHWAIVLGLTSNPGSADFQQLPLANGKRLWEQVLETVASWAGPDQLMFVAGATHPEHFESIRRIIPMHFLLVPGVGAQGGDLQAIFKAGATPDIGLLVNASRSIIYASSGPDFAEAAALEARKLALEMKSLMRDALLIA